MVYRTIMPAACSVLLLAIVAGTWVGVQAQQSTEQLGQQSAEAWLALVDSGRYGDSWQQASSLFKAHVTKDQWQSMLKATIGPLGRNTSRKLKSAKYATSLPGAPDGRYVIIEYDSSFEHKQSAIETVTPMLDKDGVWHVSGYFIK